MNIPGKADRKFESGLVRDAPAWRCQPGSGAILIVDDRPDKLVTLNAALSDLNHVIVVANSGPEALRWLLRRDFAVVLLDVNMPGMGGFETARLIRQRGRNQHTPLIFITSYGDDNLAAEGYTLGAVDFLSMPIVPAVLRSKVSVFLELHNRDAQVREQAGRLLQQTRRLQALTRASLKIHAATSIAQTLQIVADSAREILGSRQTCVIVTADHNGPAQHELVISPTGRAAAQRASFGTRPAQMSCRNSPPAPAPRPASWPLPIWGHIGPQTARRRHADWPPRSWGAAGIRSAFCWLAADVKAITLPMKRRCSCS